MLLFKRGRRPGVYVSELEKICGEELQDILGGLKGRLEDLGLELVTVDDKGDPLSEGRKRVFVRAKKPIKDKQVKICGWDRRFLAALAAVTCFLVSRGGRAKEVEVMDVLRSKDISSKKIDTMVEAGYLYRDEEVLSLSWRAMAEIDQERLRSRFLSARSTEEEGSPAEEPVE